jgi:hypothetical protein
MQIVTGSLQSKSYPRKSAGKIGILASRQTDRVMELHAGASKDSKFISRHNGVPSISPTSLDSQRVSTTTIAHPTTTGQSEQKLDRSIILGVSSFRPLTTIQPKCPSKPNHPAAQSKPPSRDTSTKTTTSS